MGSGNESFREVTSASEGLAASSRATYNAGSSAGPAGVFDRPRQYCDETLPVNRIFAPLATLAALVVLATLLLGLSLRLIGDVNDAEDTAAQHWTTIHRLAGVGAGIGIMLVNSIVVTYFVGTSRWCKEVVETYDLDGSLIAESTRLKRSTFPTAVASMLIVVGIVALGGATDPAAAMRVPPLAGVTWAQLHLAGAVIGLTAIVYFFFLQAGNIRANQAIINQVIDEVRKIRDERGLDD